MYQIKTADMDDVSEIIDRWKFMSDLDLTASPTFFCLVKDDELMSFAFVNLYGDNAIIEHIEDRGLADEELDFFVKGLVYMLSDKLDKVFSKKEFLSYGTDQTDEGLFEYKPDELFGCRCKDGV